VEPGNLASGDPGNLVERVERSTPGRASRAADVDEPLRGCRWAAALALVGAEPQGAGQVAGIGLGWDGDDPQRWEPAPEQGRVDVPHTRIEVINRAEPQREIGFHTAVGP